MKQTAIEWYFKQMQSKEHFTKDEFDGIYEQAKEIEQEQIENAFCEGFKLAFNGCTTLNLEESQFNEWLEKSKKQRCQHDFVRTSDSFDLTTYCKKCGINF